MTVVIEPKLKTVQAGVSATVVDARFCKPLDTTLLRQLAQEHSAMVTVEEGSIGGFAAHVMQVGYFLQLFETDSEDEM